MSVSLHCEVPRTWCLGVIQCLAMCWSLCDLYSCTQSRTGLQPAPAASDSGGGGGNNYDYRDTYQLFLECLNILVLKPYSIPVTYEIWCICIRALAEADSARGQWQVGSCEGPSVSPALFKPKWRPCTQGVLDSCLSSLSLLPLCHHHPNSSGKSFPALSKQIAWPPISKTGQQ